MSNVAERQKWMEQLKEYRAAILNADGGEVLEQEMRGLQVLLWEIEDRSADAIKQVVQKTTKEIGEYGMHDKTRADVCRWVQTLIIELNTQK